MGAVKLSLETLKHVDWLPTLQVNFLRAAASSFLLYTFAFFIMPAMSHQPMPPRPAIAQILGMYAAGPFVFLLFFGPVGLICKAMDQAGVPIVGWITFVFVLAFLPGDPLVWLLHKVRPSLVPVDEYGFFNRSTFIFVFASAPPEGNEEAQVSVKPQTDSEKLADAVTRDAWAGGSPHVNPFVGRSIEDLAALFGAGIKIELRPDGTIYQANRVMPEKIGYISGDRGIIYDIRDRRAGPRELGRVDSEGRVERSN